MSQNTEMSLKVKLCKNNYSFSHAVFLGLPFPPAPKLLDTPTTGLGVRQGMESLLLLQVDLL
jgi:hypothetical protein